MFSRLAGALARGRTVTKNIVVIDSVLPNKDAVGPRNSDAVEFAGKLPGFTYFTMYPMQPGPEAWFAHGYGMSKEDFDKNIDAYTAKYPETKGKIQYLSETKKYNISLAYTYFLAETYTLLPFLEKHKIPFVFLLNPGGAFGFDNDDSDKMLKRVFASPFFRKVIVNQRLLQEYLIKKRLCKRPDIIYDFSGSAQFKLADVQPKKFYPGDKPTFDVCFVAAKYSPKGVDKGYDLFIAAAHKLAKICPDMRFHVVGGFDETEIDISAIKDKVKFYGYLPPGDLPEFYSRMEIFMSPNRPFKLYKGNSDGFPLSAGAMYCGVCGFNADELHMNTEFGDDEVVIIKTQAKDIVDKAKYFYEHLDELYDISKKGQQKAHVFFDIESHIEGRIQLFKDIISEANR